jgi:hypothetical protein
MSDPVNGDTRLILHRLDQIGAQVGTLETKQDQYHETSQTRLAIVEKDQALIQQTCEAICKRVDKVEDKQDKTNLLTKIIGGISGFLTLVLTLLLAYISYLRQLITP